VYREISEDRVVAIAAGVTFYILLAIFPAVGALISTIVILLGAELDSEMEHQTARDTTEGPPKPLGVRGATVADTVGEAA
jgi:uncharacterized BrkB/YihY/UPF0761 family membrane protein